MKAKNFIVSIDRNRCKGCELCISVCPRQVLELSEEINPRGYHFTRVANPSNCIGCSNCSDMCPDTAIELREEMTRHA